MQTRLHQIWRKGNKTNINICYKGGMAAPALEGIHKYELSI